MRILFVNDLDPQAGWGAETHLRRLTTALRAGGDDVELFAGEISHRGLGKLRDLWDPAARRRLAARARTFRPDVVHHHNVVRELSVSVLGVPASVPSVMTVHDHRLVGERDDDRRSLRALADRVVKAPIDIAVARRTLDAALAVSAPLADKLRSRGFRNVEHVPVCGLEPLLPLQPVAANRDVAYLGRLTREKGAAVLAEAFALVAAEVPDARLLVAGEGPEASRLAALQDHVGEGRVVLLGRLDEADVSALLARVRLVVVPSIAPEGSSLSAVEAALHGRVVVVGDVPAFAEVLRVLGTGEPVPREDVPALAGAIRRVLADDDLATRWGRQSRERAAERYSPVAVADRVRSVHERVVAARVVAARGGAAR